MTHTLKLFILLPLLLPACSNLQPKNPGFDFAPDRPFQIALGRGAGWHGLQTILIDDAGNVRLGRNRGQQTATLTLSKPLLAQLAAAIRAHDLGHLQKKYSASIQDGTQWILVLTQDTHHSTNYFDNAFPNEITAFAQDLDALLLKAGSDTLTWTNTPNTDDQSLWHALEDPTANKPN